MKSLLFLIRRYGVFTGLLAWFNCRNFGHDWETTGRMYVREVLHCDHGVIIHRGCVKIRCACCESIRLTELDLFRLPDGKLMVFSRDGMKPKIVQ